MAMSVVAIIGALVLPGTCASGTSEAAFGSVGVHCHAPAGLLVSSHSKPNRFSQ